MSLLRKILGRSGEDLAAKYLTEQGYVILERNYRAPYGEIDVIAMDNGTVVFVEVSMSPPSMSQPLQAKQATAARPARCNARIILSYLRKPL